MPARRSSSNDLGGTLDGQGQDATPAQSVVNEIVAAGGEAVASYDDVSNFDAAEHMVNRALERYGRLDILVNNAGILRDRMLVNMTEDEWDAVIAVHLKGHFAPTRHAAAYWRARSKEGEEVRGRVINTSSPSGVFGNVGQVNYGAAKAGIASFTIIAAQELANYGVTVNCIAPNARTRMTEVTFGELAKPEEGFDPLDPANMAPLVVAPVRGRGPGDHRPVLLRLGRLDQHAPAVGVGRALRLRERLGRGRLPRAAARALPRRRVARDDGRADGQGRRALDARWLSTTSPGWPSRRSSGTATTSRSSSKASGTGRLDCTSGRAVSPRVFATPASSRATASSC